MNMNVPEFIQKIDWSLLRNQKGTLVNIIDCYDDVSRVSKDDLEGILALIDALQDYAVEALDLKAVDVYDFEVEDQESGHDERLVLQGESDEQYFARINAQTIFEMHIEGSMLYMNEEMSADFIKSIVDDPEHAEVIKSGMYANILNDVLDRPENFKKDANGHFTYDPEMYDYGFEIGRYCSKIWHSGQTKTVYVCPKCGGENVEYKTWTNPNTMETTHDHPMEDGDCYCADCETHDKLVQRQVPLT